ncbi:MAG: glycosyltransferase [Spirochaetes bacterium]|nr:glycosyltransferase [Spirochaetota bacterium]
MENQKVSIIIRTKNEERWINHCLNSVFNQTYKNIEVILVDNESTDKTIEKAKKFQVKITTIKDFLPGKAINYGIKKSTGDIIICLSGHCIPVNKNWIENLIKDLKDPKVAGIYGRQIPMSFTKDSDKRDLITTFGLDKIVQKKDPFFHNANSAFTRKIWEKFPFDEKITNIEDRLWGELVISNGYMIIYEPEAEVYHHHGIHQDNDPERCKNVVTILQSLNKKKRETIFGNFNLENMNIIALIPHKGKMTYYGKHPLIWYTIERAKQSKYINDTYILTDNKEMVEYGKNQQLPEPFLRPKELSEDFIGIDEVLSYSLNSLEKKSVLSDICIILEETYPFRDIDLIDNLIEKFVFEGMNSLIPVYRELRSVWYEKNKEIDMIIPYMPRHLKKEDIYIGLFGLGFITQPQNIRDGSLGLNNLNMYLISEYFSTIEVKDNISKDIVNNLLKSYFKLT